MRILPSPLLYKFMLNPNCLIWPYLSNWLRYDVKIHIVPPVLQVSTVRVKVLWPITYCTVHVQGGPQWLEHSK